MKSLVIVLCLATFVGNLYGDVIYVDISSPGQTVEQSTIIGNSTTPHVRVDYYTSASPGTHYKLVNGGRTYSQLRMHNNSHLTLSGGMVNGDLWFYDNSVGDIVSGNAGYTRVTENSHLKMTGGTVGSYFGVYDNGRAEITGGHLSGVMQITGNALATLSGHDFKIGGQSMSMGQLNISQLVNNGLMQVLSFPEYNNVQYQGNLTGFLSDGSSLNLTLSFTHFTDSRGNSANLCLIPEPATLVLLWLGGLFLRKKSVGNNL